MNTAKRVVIGIKDGVVCFVSDIAHNIRGLTILCLATIGSLAVLTGIGATSFVATAGAVAGVWLLAI